MMTGKVSQFCMAVATALLAATGLADVIHLNTGGRYRGEVTGFSGSAFLVKTAGGATTNLAANTVGGIDFEHGYVTAKLDTKPTGSVTGKLWLFDKQQFNLEVAGGESRRIALGNVSSAAFSYTRGPDTPRPAPAKTTPASTTASDRADIEVIAHGERVDIQRYLVDRKVTVVDFYADWCGPCRSLAPILEGIAQQDSEVAVRKVDIVRWGTPVAEQYSINSIPHLEIYDRRGNLVHTMAGFNEGELRASIERAKK